MEESECDGFVGCRLLPSFYMIGTFLVFRLVFVDLCQEVRDI